ncbi:unnamed protein product [Vitrella brassicaformis CCMP3155]|uniref:Uncharacterized protein n=1 Tax=Vitrella brassicaformis (strain CCMP3155) TaxID=1169540 RepID=A0A0G4ESL9_VITBC|nr:unnamed protein product [Vitrella brassicaformis CCMP3155]|eukprot:CEM00865.1 unnamed protein product [Vitrella brassicaformis CCMP3155]
MECVVDDVEHLQKVLRALQWRGFKKDKKVHLTIVPSQGLRFTLTTDAKDAKCTLSLKADEFFRSWDIHEALRGHEQQQNGNNNGEGDDGDEAMGVGGGADATDDGDEGGERRLELVITLSALITSVELFNEGKAVTLRYNPEAGDEDRDPFIVSVVDGDDTCDSKLNTYYLFGTEEAEIPFEPQGADLFSMLPSLLYQALDVFSSNTDNKNANVVVRVWPAGTADYVLSMGVEGDSTSSCVDYPNDKKIFSRFNVRQHRRVVYSLRSLQILGKGLKIGRDATVYIDVHGIMHVKLIVPHHGRVDGRISLLEYTINSVIDMDHQEQPEGEGEGYADGEGQDAHMHDDGQGHQWTEMDGWM